MTYRPLRLPAGRMAQRPVRRGSANRVIALASAVSAIVAAAYLARTQHSPRSAGAGGDGSIRSAVTQGSDQQDDLHSGLQTNEDAGPELASYSVEDFDADSSPGAA